MTTIPTNLYEHLFPELNVAELDVVEGAAGPGRRLVIWLQGCLKRCAGCANGTFLLEGISRALSVARLLEVLDGLNGLSGVTLSGGEPVLQAAALVPFLEAVRQRGLTVVCYSGYTLEELREPNDPTLAKFLREIDLLIDGEYRQELPRAGAYRPSANQRLHFLSGRIAAESCAGNVETVFEINGEHAVATGILPMAIRREIFARLRAQGIHLRPVS